MCAASSRSLFFKKFLEVEMSKQANAPRRFRIWICAGSLALSLPLALAGAAEAASSLSRLAPPQVSMSNAPETQRSMQPPANARQNEMQKLPQSSGGAPSAVRAQGGNAMKEAGTTAKSGGAASQMQRDVKSASQSNAPQGSQAKANQSASTSKLSGAQQQLQNLQARQQQTMGGTGRAKSQ
jgi:hypothetical protein